MNTPHWMTDAPAHAPQRAKPVRHNRRSTDRRSPSVVDLSLAFLAMLVTMWSICELNSLLLR
jgi:hypothetical protein